MAEAKHCILRLPAIKNSLLQTAEIAADAEQIGPLQLTELPKLKPPPNQPLLKLATPTVADMATGFGGASNRQISNKNQSQTERLTFELSGAEPQARAPKSEALWRPLE